MGIGPQRGVEGRGGAVLRPGPGHPAPAGVVGVGMIAAVLLALDLGVSLVALVIVWRLLVTFRQVEEALLDDDTPAPPPPLSHLQQAAEHNAELERVAHARRSRA